MTRVVRGHLPPSLAPSLPTARSARRRTARRRRGLRGPRVRGDRRAPRVRAFPRRPLGAEHPEDASPRPGGTLRLASFQDIRDLDPAGPSDALALQPHHLIFAGLARLRRARGASCRTSPSAGTSTDGGRTYRFIPPPRRRDARRQRADRRRRQAARVERALHPSTPNPNASYFGGLRGYRAFADGQAPSTSTASRSRGVTSSRFASTSPTPRSSRSWRCTPSVPCAARRGTATTTPGCRAAPGPSSSRRAAWQRGTSLRLFAIDGILPSRPAVPRRRRVDVQHAAARPARFASRRASSTCCATSPQADQARFAADPALAPVRRHRRRHPRSTASR